MRSITFNLFTLVSYPVGIYLCHTGKVSWWVLLIVILFSFEFNITRRR